MDGVERIVRVYPYGQNRVKAALMFVAACCGCVMLWYVALHHSEKDRYPQYVSLGLAVFSSLSVPMLGLLLLSSLIRDYRIAFTPDSIILPKPTFHWLSREELEIPLAHITAFDVVPFVGSALMLRIAHRDGKAMIFSNAFPEKRIFREVVSYLRAALDRAGDVADSGVGQA